MPERTVTVILVIFQHFRVFQAEVSFHYYLLYSYLFVTLSYQSDYLRG